MKWVMNVLFMLLLAARGLADFDLRAALKEIGGLGAAEGDVLLA